MTAMSPAQQAAVLADGCAEIETREELESRIATKGRLSVKFGIDPTGALLHLGHAVVLRKLQQFVELGHRAVLLIGDFTARIGDPTGRDESRPALSEEEIAENMRTYREQAGLILDLDRVEIAKNSEWLGALTLGEMIGLMTQTTVAQMLARHEFAQRYADGVPISLHEFLYPIAQAYDSVAMQCDVELGGSDQLFNFLMARDYQKHAGQPPQICMTVPILEGTDGVVRMGKSRGNYVALAEAATEQFGKLMRIPDELVPRYAHLAAFWPAQEVGKLVDALRTGRYSPMDAKKRVAEDIVSLYHGKGTARSARERFEATVQRRELPADMPTVAMSNGRRIAELLLQAGFAVSKREAERLIKGGGVKLDGVPVTDPNAAFLAEGPAVLSVGARRFVRVLPEVRS
ncbi:MAG: tyrosine--tRNA ligase [Candidatus Eremiobacteraeota bacterium]|nr:tyrosine--tRNA ligase [Candidatus Eremiobacteraeota bacterium]